MPKATEMTVVKNGSETRMLQRLDERMLDMF